jgi:hypothetical protein
MSFTDSFLDRAHRFCTRNFEDAKRSQICGCFSCLAVFPGHDVISSYPEVAGYYAEIDGCARKDTQTADCPRCGLDTVLPGNSELPIADKGFLRAMQKRWVWQFKGSGTNA